MIDHPGASADDERFDQMLTRLPTRGFIVAAWAVIVVWVEVLLILRRYLG